MDEIEREKIVVPDDHIIRYRGKEYGRDPAIKALMDKPGDYQLIRVVKNDQEVDVDVPESEPDYIRMLPVDVPPDPRKFNAVIQPGPFKKALEILHVLVREVVLDVDRDRIYAKCVDPSHAAMLHLSIPRSAFESFDVEGVSLIGISLDDLPKLNGGIVTLYPDGITSDTELKQIEAIPIVDFSGTEAMMHVYKPSMTKEHEFFCIMQDDIVDKTEAVSIDIITKPKLPDINPKSTATIGSDDLKRYIERAKEVSDYLDITITEDGVLLNTHMDKREVSCDLPVVGGRSVDVSTDGEVKSRYPIEWLQKILKIMPTCNLILNIGQDYPAVINMQLPVTKGNDISVTFMMAPRTM